MPQRRGEKVVNPPPPDDDPDLGDVSAELSQLLAELAKTPEVEVDVAAGWAPALAPGDVVADRFELRRELGRGGFGVVFEALDRELGREVAFKVVRPGRRASKQDSEWVRREAKAVACLNHPNIVTIHDLGAAPSGPYLIFELLRGETLAQRLQRGPFTLREAIALALQISRVLDHAHRAGVVHRDLKPANVFLCAGGPLKVLDFGLAHLFGRAGPVSGGTPAYMAPEQWRSDPGDERTDLFSLGVLLHQMLSGALPYAVLRDGSRERSEAEAPGPAPALPRGAAPDRVRRLVQRMLEKNPARRPGRASEVVSELQRVQRGLDGGLRRPAVAIGAAAAVAALVIAVASAARRVPPPAIAPLVVAVADFENRTGDRELDGLSGLLVTSLEQSRQLRILTRTRLLATLRGTGKGDLRRIDESTARELARAAGAQVLLAGSAGRSGDAFSVEVRLVDPAGGGSPRAFTESASGKADVLGAIDRISDEARRALREREEDVRSSRVQVSQAVTSSLEAYDAYFQGLDCVARPSLAPDRSWIGCAAHFRRALELDPTFALAHFQLAWTLGTAEAASHDVQTHIDAALRYVDKVPPKEADLVRAWKAHLDGRDAEALAICGRVLGRFPDDPQGLAISGDLYFHRSEMAAAVPFFQKLVALEPEAEWPLDHLVTALAVQHRKADLEALLARVEALPRTEAREQALVEGYAWVGASARSLELARAAVEREASPAARNELAAALAASGRFAEAEEVLRAIVADRSDLLGARRSLAAALRAQGRRAEALRVLHEAERTMPDPNHAFARALLIAGDGDVRALWREAARAESIQPGSAALLAVVLAMAGDLRHAADFSAAAEPGSTAAVEYAALVAWREGDAPRALARLGALEATDPWPQGQVPPSYLIAEIALDAGDNAEAAAAADRYRALWPMGLWRGWAYPRSLYVSAVALERHGDRDGARRSLAALLALLRRAERDEPLLSGARALEARLAK